MSGDVRMLAQQSERHAEYCRLAAEKGHHITPDMIGTINPDELLRMILPPRRHAALQGLDGTLQ